MTPFGWLKNLVRRGEDPARYRRWIPVNIDGLKLTPDQMLSTSAVWGCINAISNAISGCQWQLYTPLGPHKRQLLYADPLNWLLNTRPNQDCTAMGLREALLIQAVAWGNAYAEIVPDRMGRPAALYPLLSDRVMPRRDLDTWQLVYDVIEADGSITSVSPDRIFHLHGPGVSGVLGENIIARAARSIAVAVAQEKYAAGFFGRGASPNGILQVEKKMSEPVKAALKKDFAERQAGLANAHTPMVLEDGTKWTPLGIEPQKAQLAEEQQFSVEQIARWFGVPLHKIGHLLRATFSNIEQQDLQFVRDTLTPWARRLEQEADFKLVGPRAPRFTCIDLKPLTQGDAASRAAYYASGLQNGWLTINEARAQEGLDSIGPDGDVPLVNGASKPLELVLNPPPPPPPPAPKALPAGNADGADTGDQPQQDDASDVARKSLSVIVAGAVERHARRLENARAKERRSKTPQEVDAILSAETERSLERLKAELRPALAIAAPLGLDLNALDVERAVSLFEQGQPVLKALPAGA